MTTIKRQNIGEQMEALTQGGRRDFENDPATPSPAAPVGDEALHYAQMLAAVLHEKHYKTTAPDWKPLPDTLGLLTQIDNMTVQLVMPDPTGGVRVKGLQELEARCRRLAYPEHPPIFVEIADELSRILSAIDQSPVPSEPVAGPRIKPEIITTLREWAEFEQDGGNVEQGAAIDVILDWYDRVHTASPVSTRAEAMAGALPFDEWWSKDGQYVDPDTADVPWFDKRRGLAAYAYRAGQDAVVGLSVEDAALIGMTLETVAFRGTDTLSRGARIASDRLKQAMGAKE